LCLGELCPVDSELGLVSSELFLSQGELLLLLVEIIAEKREALRLGGQILLVLGCKGAQLRQHRVRSWFEARGLVKFIHFNPRLGICFKRR